MKHHARRSTSRPPSPPFWHSIVALWIKLPGNPNPRGSSQRRIAGDMWDLRLLIGERRMPPSQPVEAVGSWR
jgi:hypothetical protein